jgi:uncharacterized protein (DUF433 family)
MIPLRAFTLPTVSRLTELSESRLRDRDRGGFFQPSLADPDRRRHYSRIYSFGDVVALRTIKSLLERDVPIGRLKEIGTFLCSLPDASWASQRFYVVGRDVYFTHEDALLAAKPLGQMAMREILEIALRPVVEDTKRRVAELRERPEEQIGQIDSDRYIMNGKSVIAGTRTPTAVIYELHREGLSVDGIREEFPRLTPEDIQAAIAFEQADTLALMG